jgi:hypothetical protein
MMADKSRRFEEFSRAVRRGAYNEALDDAGKAIVEQLAMSRRADGGWKCPPSAVLKSLAERLEVLRK